MAELAAKIRQLVSGGMHPRTAREVARVEAGLPRGYSDPSLRDITRPTGTEIFNAKSPAEQDAMLGPKAAEAVRAGEVGLDELVERSPLDTAPDYITQKPLPQEGTNAG
jgi:hypothetical protein